MVKRRRFLLFSLLVVLASLFTACAPPQESGNNSQNEKKYGAVAFQIIWDQGGKTSRNRVMYLTPPGVVRMDITLDKTYSFAATPGQPGYALISDVPVGTYNAVLEGKNYAGAVVYEITVTDVGVSDGVTTTPPPVVIPKVDTTPPTVNATDPIAGAISVRVYTNVNITFSEAMDTSSINANSITLAPTAQPLNYLTANVSFNTVSFIATLNPGVDLALETQYTCAISSDVMDCVENNLDAPLSFSFTTEPGLTDDNPPTVTGQSPLPTATGVAVGSSVYFEIDDTGTGVDLSTLNVTFEGVNVISGGSLQSDYGGSIAVDGAGGYNVTINPDVDFGSLQTVAVTINAQDLAPIPNVMTPVSYSFSCAGTESWSSTGSMSEARTAHTATRLNNGLILIAGGENSSIGEIYSSCELYNPVAGTWSAAGSMNDTRRAHTATLLADGRVLVVGGRRGDVFISSCELYDPVAGTWSYTDDLGWESSNHTATLLKDGRVLIAGGHQSSSPPWSIISSCKLYDPANDTWSTTGNMNQNRTEFTATLLDDGRVLVAGASNYPQSEISSCELYNY